MINNKNGKELWGCVGVVVAALIAGIVSLIVAGKLSLPTQTPFTDTWQGIDPYDGSAITLTLVQTENELIGTTNDTFSLNVKPPGLYGKGSGTVLSLTTAQMVFNLSRWDGVTAKWKFYLTLSNQNNALTLSNCSYNDVDDPVGCPLVMQRK